MAKNRTGWPPKDERVSPGRRKTDGTCALHDICSERLNEVVQMVRSRVSTWVIILLVTIMIAVVSFLSVRTETLNNRFVEVVQDLRVHMAIMEANQAMVMKEVFDMRPVEKEEVKEIIEQEQRNDKDKPNNSGG